MTTWLGPVLRMFAERFRRRGLTRDQIERGFSVLKAIGLYWFILRLRAKGAFVGRPG